MSQNHHIVTYENNCVFVYCCYSNNWDIVSPIAKSGSESCRDQTSLITLWYNQSSMLTMYSVLLDILHVQDLISVSYSSL